MLNDAEFLLRFVLVNYIGFVLIYARMLLEVFLHFQGYNWANDAYFFLLNISRKKKERHNIPDSQVFSSGCFYD